MTGEISVVIVDDHDLVREGLRSVLSQARRHRRGRRGGERHAGVDEVVAEADPTSSCSTCASATPTGSRSPGAAGGRVRRAASSSSASTTPPVTCADALAAGADGYLLKSVSGSVLADGIRKAVAGETVIGQEFVPKLLEDAVRGASTSAKAEVTAREQEVLELVAAGLANRSIAEQLGISTRTAQKHVENLFKKFDVHDRTELVAQAFRRGLLG
jgi:DNA-binding NarL/FixJ family response regulator